MVVQPGLAREDTEQELLWIIDTLHNEGILEDWFTLKVPFEVLINAECSDMGTLAEPRKDPV